MAKEESHTSFDSSASPFAHHMKTISDACNTLSCAVRLHLALVAANSAVFKHFNIHHFEEQEVLRKGNHARISSRMMRDKLKEKQYKEH